LPHFEYVAPRTLDEACSLLATWPGEASPLAGGTDLLVKMKQRRIIPRYIVNLKTISGMDYITYNDNDGLRVGALTTIQSLKNSITINRHCRIFAQAAGVESSVQIRNVATLGGNISNASPAADAPLALIALGASLGLAPPGGHREISLEDFYVGPGKTVLQPGEIVREIHVPPLSPRTGGAYLKHAVRRTDIAIVSVAVVLTLADDLCHGVKIALGSVAPTAFRAQKAERLLSGQKITEELADAAAQAAVNESSPIDDIRGYAEYRTKMVLAVTKHAIMQALQDARLGGI
jgi:CO/xanthine dehydrogenase FAD-binding subunit